MTRFPQHIRRAAQHRRMPWANGGGMTREIVAAPESGEWWWRLSIADVVGDGPFSLLPGVQRTIALLQGRGFVLRVGGAVAQPIIEPFQPMQFDGGDATDCALVDGPVMDLNLMERGAARTLDLRFMTVAAEGVCSVTGALAVVVVAGAVVAGAVVTGAVVTGAVVTGGDELGVLDAVIGSSPAIEPLVFAGGSDGAVLAVVGSVR